MIGKKPFIVLMIIPTGVGAEIGGYAGDATPAANLLASICDTLVVNPNVVNGAAFMEASSNILYVEGAAIDGLMQGRIGLQPVQSNKIGIVLDGAIRSRDKLLAAVMVALDAVRTNAGVEILGYTFTSEPIGGQCVISPSGGSQGIVEGVEPVWEAVQRLVDRGAQAIALFSLIQNPSASQEILYRQGKGVDPIGGIEAILSHLVVKKFHLPAAHGPIFEAKEEDKTETERDKKDQFFHPTREGKTKGEEESSPFNKEHRPLFYLPDPRAAAEELEAIYIPCVLKGLARAPRLVAKGGISVEEIDALVVPQGVLGGVAALEALQRGIPIIVVEENRTVLSVTAEKLKRGDKIICARNYLEAAGILSCMRSGIDWKLVARPVPPLQEI